MPVCAPYYAGGRYPKRCDSVPVGRSRIGRGFHPKKARR